MKNRRGKGDIVYITSMGVTAAVVAWGLLSPGSFKEMANLAFAFLTQNYGWGYMLMMNCYVLFPIWLSLSRFGGLKLGEPESKPEFSTISWFAMLFSAGMGVGLVFYGVGEPLFHYMTPPFGAAPGSAQAARDAMRASFFHWGLHPWAGYSVVALSLAYFQFRKGAPGLMSSMFMPILGEKKNESFLGRTIDILTIFATAAGIATSLGLGVMQISSGIGALMPSLQQSVDERTMQISIIVVLGLIYTWTAASGIDKGIKFISNLNLLLASLLLVALFAVGSKVTLINVFMTGLGDYFSNIISQSFDLAPWGGPYKDWLSGWTIYYWAWWIAWAPFVGSFIARISRGRTIREFTAGVLIVPALGSFVWFSVFGGSALNIEISGIAEIGKAVTADISTGAFKMYEYYPLGKIMSAIMLILISTFFITSANSATYVLSMFSSGGSLTPPRLRMTVWGILQAALATVLLVTGGLGALQTVSIVAAAPFSVIMLVSCWCLWRTLIKDSDSLLELKK